ncbi:MAG: YbaB/EbfC family nucleoid-associated protein [Candidatus Magasanikbacteria bacterium]|nr:YbaB/EbfC family nucleoid-associated protein [Candidatus Magasanikbacteria bacterium]
MSMFAKLKQFKDMRTKAKSLQNLLADEKVEATAAWGKIKMTMNGNQEAESVTIDQELLTDKSKLENAIKEVTNDAIKKTQRVMADKIRKEGGLNMPGL